MSRLLPIAAAAACGLTGCAGTWDTLTSRKFREHPYDTLFKTEDPMVVLRTSPEGGERAKAMWRLKEPALDGRPGEQDEAIGILANAASTDPSPVVRVAAIDALGRFRDERAVQALTAAYHQAGGTATATAAKPATTGAIPAGGAPGVEDPATLAERFTLSGPAGFPPEVATLVRSRAVSAMASTGRPEVVPLLAQAAVGEAEADRDTRLAAVRGLTKVRGKESVAALSRVLTLEKGKDPALAGRAYAGLKDLTGQQHPADPQTWEAVVRGGTYDVQPPPSAVQQAAAWVLNDD